MKFFHTVIYVLFVLTIHAQNIQFSDVNFKEALLNDNVADIDGDGTVDGDLDLNDDGEIQVSEAESVFYLRLNYKEISDISEIFHFKNLVRLNLRHNQLIAADVSSLSELVELELDNNMFEELIIENMVNLEVVDLESNDNLRYVSLDGCTNLKSLSRLFVDRVIISNTNADFAEAYLRNKSVSIDSIVANNTGLSNLLTLKEYSLFNNKYLDLRYNEIDTLVVEEETFFDVKQILLEGNPISHLEINDLSSESDVDLNSINNTLESININIKDSKVLKLENLSNISNIETKAFDLTLINLPSLKAVSNIGNQGYSEMRSLTLNNMAGLETIEYGYVRLDKFSLVDLPSLRKVSLNNTISKGIVFEDLVELDTVNLDRIDEDTIIFRNLDKLTHLNITHPTTNDDNDINEIRISNCASMDQLFRKDQDVIGTARIRSLKVNNMPMLRKIHLKRSSNNTHIDIEINDLPLLDSIKILDYKFINSLTIEDFPNLQSIIYTTEFTGFESLRKLKLDNLPKLSNIYISDVPIDSLSLINFPKIETLYISRPRGFVELDYFPGLKNLELLAVPMDTLLLNDYPELAYINLTLNWGDDDDVYLEFNDLPKLHTLISSNKIVNPVLELKDMNNLKVIKFRKLWAEFDEKLEEIKIENLPFLQDLDSDYFINVDSLYNHNLEGFLNLENISIQSNQGGIFIDNLPSLKNFYFNGHFDEENFYDFSSCPLIESVRTNQWWYQKSDYNFKNGTNSLTNFESNGKIRNVCVDNQEEEDHLRAINDETGDTYFTTDCPDNVIKTFNTINGKLVYSNTPDLCSFSNAYTGFNRVNIFSNSYSGTIYSDQDGFFDFRSDNINEEIIFTAVIDDESNYSLYEESDTVIFADYDNMEDMKFCMYPVSPITDYDVLLVPLNSAIPGFEVGYKLIVRNLGNTALDGAGNINLSFDSDVMEFIQESPFTALQGNDSIAWYFVNLLPFQEKEIDIKFKLNTPVASNPLNSGDILNLSLSIDEDLLDENSENDVFNLQHEVVNSFDPNDITCIEGMEINKEYIGNSIHYRIRFENLGTASAQNIYVTNKIDTSVFDLESFIPLIASDNMKTEIIGGDTILFNFENIYLPSTGNNKGYLLYRIDIKDNLSEDRILENDANIYFDFNAPIYTGLSQVNFKDIINSTSSHINTDSLVDVYPNPTMGNLRFVSSFPIIEFSLFNDLGNLAKQGQLYELRKGEINLIEVKSGLYTLILKGKNGYENIIRILKL